MPGRFFLVVLVTAAAGVTAIVRWTSFALGGNPLWALAALAAVGAMYTLYWFCMDALRMERGEMSLLDPRRDPQRDDDDEDE